MIPQWWSAPTIIKEQSDLSTDLRLLYDRNEDYKLAGLASKDSL